jgi:acyl-CoA hydrolase/RimJ/RimL family protein N-acetyltransferase
MPSSARLNWESRLVSPQAVLTHIKPGTTIFIGTGPATPRTLLKELMDSDAHNAKDLELVQLATHGNIMSVADLHAHKNRLKTFFSGYIAWKTIRSGRVDLIPAYSSHIPRILKSGQIPIDVAFIQVTPPNEAGYCSLGVAVDVAREAMDQASLVVGEINPDTPFTFGDTFVSINDFDFLVRSEFPPVTYERWDVDETMDRVAANIASVIKNGDCLCFSYSPLFEALAPHLVHKRDLGIHSLYFTDALMDLVKSGVVTNSRKTPFRGKSLTSYALGTDELFTWLDRNPLVEFQGVDWVCNPTFIGQNPQFATIYEARKVDLLGGVAFPTRGKVASGPGEVIDFFSGAEISQDGCTIFGLPSRDENGEPNIMVALMNYPNQFRLRESVHMIATEYGVANVKWRTLRERAQAIIDIAHPDDREHLVAQAREGKVIYPNQIYISETAHLYPSHIAHEHTFKGGVTVRFRAMKPSDEEAMRRFFYRFSEKPIFYRFFYPVRTMAHDKMQEYVNIDYSSAMSIIGLVGEAGHEKIIAEARFMRDERDGFGDFAFLIEEQYHGIGIGSYLMDMLVRLAREQGLKGVTAEVLAGNAPMMKIFEKANLPLEAHLQDGVYHIKIPFEA